MVRMVRRRLGADTGPDASESESVPAMEAAAADLFLSVSSNVRTVINAMRRTAFIHNTGSLFTSIQSLQRTVAESV